MSSINEIIKKQHRFFDSGQTLNLNFRIEKLKKLRDAIKSNEGAILSALKADLNKPTFEAYTTEIMQILNEIKFTIKHLKKWAKPHKVKTPIELQPGRSMVYAQPFGVVLNIAPWNYPFQICLSPLVSILAAGNCAVVKPSELAPHSSELMARLIGNTFPSEYCAVVEGDIDETQALLAQKWDFIAFTGSPRVGRIIAQSAVNNLTPTLLELGGKSPCIVHGDANITIAARRIVWGKFLNAGQTCTAPDFVIVNKRIAEKLNKEMINQLLSFYGKNPKVSVDYARIVNKKHFERLHSYLNHQQILYGGQTDPDLFYIEPTILYKSNWDDKIMEEEIFGPLLPVIEYDNIEIVIDKLKERERPLALYLFTKDKALQKKIVESIHFGGGCLNATIMHNGSPALPFGGVGNSGMGRYNGKSGFDTFSYQKSIFYKPTWIDLKLPYPPYKQKINLVRKFS